MIVGDCLDVLKDFPDNHFDCVITSPPYESQRSYDIGFNLKGDQWVDWALPRYLECVRVCKGLVAWVVEGSTKNFEYSATPIKLMSKLLDNGVKLRKPPIYHRIGIPGSGGSEWLRNDYEFVICSTKGRLPWSDNTALGHPPKYKPGGNLSHHKKSGRVNQEYRQPKKVNPGNIITCRVGGGHMGSKLAHENEAPFPEKLAEFFILSFCPPKGKILDPFCGSGTTLVVARDNGRDFVGIDIRKSQIELSKRRLNEKTN